MLFKPTRKISIIFITLAFVHSAYGWQWIKTYAGSRNSPENFSSSIAMSSSHVFMSGWYGDTMIIDNDTLISKGHRDPFILKSDFQGRTSWVTTIHQKEQPSMVNRIGICTDSLENLYMAGIFVDSAQIGTTLVLPPDTGQNHLLLVKYDSKGNFIWAKVPEKQSDYFYDHQIINVPGTGILTSFWSGYPVEINGHVYNITFGMVNYDYDGNVKNVIENGSEIMASAQDGSIAYLSGNNSLIITNGAGSRLTEIFGTENITFSSADFDQQKNLYVYGCFFGRATLDGASLECFDTTVSTKDTTIYVPVPGQPNLYRRIDTTITTVFIHSRHATFIAKYDLAGNQVWAKTNAKSWNISIYGNLIKVLNDQTIIVAGNFSDSVTIGHDKFKTDIPLSAFISRVSSNGLVIQSKVIDTVPYLLNHPNQKLGEFEITGIAGNANSNLFAQGTITVYDSLGNPMYNSRTIFFGCIDANILPVKPDLCNRFSDNKCKVYIRKDLIRLTLPGNSEINGTIGISIFNLKGQSILKTTVAKRPSEINYDIPINLRASKGFYLVAINNSGRVSYFRFMYDGL